MNEITVAQAQELYENGLAVVCDGDRRTYFVIEDE